jgi:GLPGLI family protein
MKKLFINLVVAVISVSTFSNAAFAQKTKAFEGTITYTLNFDEAGLDPASASMLQGREMIISIKGDKSRMEMDMGMMKNVTIADSKSGDAVTLLDIMGQKMAIKMTKEQLEKQKAETKEPEIVYSDETKEVAGYKCKKATIKSEDGEELAIYYTDEIPSSNSATNQFKGLKGFPLEYQANQNGLKMLVSAKSVKTGKVEDSKFKVSSDYKEVTQEELQRMFGGGE